MQEEVEQFRAGQSVKCRVVAPKHGGYDVKLIPSNIDGFLPCQEELTEGHVVPATFVCMVEKRALMTFAFRIGTTERVQLGLPSEEETAFAVWADSHPRTFKLRRAIDLVMPPIGAKPVFPIKSRDYDILQLFKDLENGRMTGTVKVINDEELSRGALLLYQGRAVGCIYNRKPNVEPYPMETALQMSILDSFQPASTLIIYDLPAEVITSMSAMFLGVPVSLGENKEALKILRNSLKAMKKTGETGCFTLSLPNEGDLALVLFYRGDLFGVFHVDGQAFSGSLQSAEKLIKKSESATLELSILPKEMMSDAVLFGYGLSTTITELEEGPARAKI